MKKFFSVLGLMVFSLFVMTACGVVGSTEATSVSFVRDVFYVDPDIKTHLDYKVSPLSASGYNISFTPIADAQNHYFDFEANGNITIYDGFYPISVTIHMGDLSDTCEVRKREYPTKIGFYDDEDQPLSRETLFGGMVYQLKLKVDGETLRTPENGEYNYKITSSNPSVVAIENEERLLVRSTGRRGSSTIRVNICDSEGKEKRGLEASITLDVENQIGSAFVSIGDSVSAKNEGVVTLSGTLQSEHEIVARYFDENGYKLDSNDFSAHLNNTGVLEVVSREGKTYLKIIAEGTVVLTIQSKGICPSGLPHKIVVTIQVRNLG